MIVGLFCDRHDDGYAPAGTATEGQSRDSEHWCMDVEMAQRVSNAFVYPCILCNEGTLGLRQRRWGSWMICKTFLVALMSFGLAACASRPEDVLLPVAAYAPGTSSVDLLVATTRQSIKATGQLYSGERGRDLSFVNIVVSIPPDSVRKPGEVNWPKRSPGNSATDFVTTKVTQLDLPQTRKWLDAHGTATRKHRAIVFVHGFNNRFDDAVFRFAQIVHDTGAEVTPVLFTWPSRGSVFAYGYDRESANFSRDALEDTLNMLARDPAISEVDILAHSMGNWLVLETLRQMAIRDRHLPTKIANVMLASPDVDVDVFGKELADMGNSHANFSLFVSQDDHALAASQWLSGGVTRLGAINPDAEPYKSELAAEHITVFDLTKLKADDQLNHSKFASSPELVRLVTRRLEQGQVIDDYHESLADKVVGATAGEVEAVESSLETAESVQTEAPKGKTQ
ncbi:alpha/beta hydrolase [Bradyrhizobium sp. Arg314]